MDDVKVWATVSEDDFLKKIKELEKKKKSIELLVFHPGADEDFREQVRQYRWKFVDTKKPVERMLMTIYYQ